MEEFISLANYENSETWDTHIRWAEVVYTTNPRVAELGRKLGKPIVVDLLVHEYFEDLEHLPLREMRSIEKTVFFSDSIAW